VQATARIVAALTLLSACTQGGPNQAVPAEDDDVVPAMPETDAASATPAVSETSLLSPFDAVAPRAAFSAVVRAERASPPLSGGTLAVGASGQVVLSDPDRDLLYVVDVVRKSSVTIPLEPGDEPGRATIAGTTAYVALRGTGSLLTVDLTRREVQARTPVCPAPRGVYFDAEKTRVLTACAGGELVSVSPDGLVIQAQTLLPADLRDVGRDAQGLWVSQFRSAALLRLTADLTLAARLLPANIEGVPPPDPRTGSQTDPTLQFAPTLAYRTVSSGAGAPMVLHQRAQSSTVNPEPGGYGGGRRGFCEGGIVHTTVTQFDREDPLAQVALPQAVVPTDLGVSPDGQVLALVAPGNFVRQDVTPVVANFDGVLSRPAQQLYLMEAAALSRTDGTTALGSTPDDCLLDAARWEHRFPGEATAVQFLDAHTLLVQVRSPAELHVFTFAGVDDTRLSAVIPLSPLAVRDTGHEVFHQNTGSGIACASCHGEALDDGHVWTFEGAGARRTQHLRGGVVETAPFHWSGDLATFDALIDDVYQKRMSGPLLPPEARAALSGWLNQVPLIVTAAHDVAAAERGRALFASTGVDCVRCHAGESLRSSGAYDVGTGGLFEVPSLRGVGLRLPLLHNGCADTLEKRFEPGCGGGDQHGKTSQLSASELADMVSYLGSL
jgi:mono/diheme cytochrome c family protein